MKYPTVKFRDQIFANVRGALTTKWDYENGIVSYAHVFPNGEIKRFNRVIGHERDLESVGEIEMEPNLSAVSNLFDPDCGW